MKIEQITTAFKPLSLVIETAREAAYLAALMGKTTGAGDRRIGVDVYDTFRILKEAAGEGEYNKVRFAIKGSIDVPEAIDNSDNDI